MDKHQALYGCWSSFGLPAYDQYTVPDGATMPYITYEDVTDSLGNVVNMTASLWYRDPGWAAISRKAQEIADAIEAMDPITLPLDTGRLYLTRGTPWAQRMNEPDDSGIRRVVLNLQAEYLTQS